MNYYKKQVLILSIFPISLFSQMEIYSSINSYSFSNDNSIKFSSSIIPNKIGNFNKNMTEGILDIEKKVLPLNIRGLKANIYSKTNANIFFAGQIFELSDYDRMVYPVTNHSYIEIIELTDIGKLQYSNSYTGIYSDVILGNKYKAIGYFKIPSTTTVSNNPDIKFKTYLYDNNSEEYYTDGNSRNVAINIIDTPLDEYINYGENSSYRFGLTMKESYNFCKDIEYNFIGCGLFNTIDTSIDSDNDGISNYDELYYGLNPNLSSDALLDNDGDGSINSNEIILNTDLNNPSSY